jgi:exosortase/archaeosortase family protein
MSRLKQSKSSNSQPTVLLHALKARKSSVVRFLLILSTLLSAWYILNQVGQFMSAFDSYVAYNAHICASLLHFCGQSVTVSGNEIHSSRCDITIERECTGVEFMILLFALMVSFPASLRYKALGICGAVLTMWIVNIARIGSLCLIGNKQTDLFDIVHEEIWPSLFVLIAIAISAIWIGLVIGNKTISKHENR